MSVLHKTVYVEETIMAGFRPIQLGEGARRAHSQERQTENDRAHCSHWLTTRTLQLIYSHGCLFIEGEGTAFFIS